MNEKNNKTTILHIIDDFAKGGAEATVIGTLKHLTEYRNIVVTLYPKNEFADDLVYDKYYCLQLKSYLSFIKGAIRLRKIIRENNVDIVHSTLYWSMIIARLGTPKNITLISSIQSSISDGVEYKKKFIYLLDKWTYKLRRSIILGVSEFAMKDYFNFLKIKPFKCFVLYNYVDANIYSHNAERNIAKNTFKLISVGNLKVQKNQQYLLEAFKLLKDENIELDIYGKGTLREDFQHFIDRENIKVNLKGSVNNLSDLLPQYDLFVMSSNYEGFALAVLEGMAMEIPMLLSDIPTFREQCGETAHYFDLKNHHDFVEKLKYLMQHQSVLTELSINGKQRVLNYFTLEHHVKKLSEIYKENIS